MRARVGPGPQSDSYKLHFSAEIHPGGFPRVLGVGQAHALRLQHLEGEELAVPSSLQEKNRMLGENLYTEDLYLDKLHTLMLAHALAGASPLVGVTDPSKEKTLGSNFSEFVEVPLDVVMAYWYRANQLGFHGSRCVTPDERSEWVSL